MIWVLCFATWTLFAPFAEGSGFVIHVGPGKRNFPIAIEKPVGSPDVATKLWSVVRRDLEMTGYFQIINPDAYIDQSQNVVPNSFNFADWRLVQAAALAKTAVRVEGDTVQADLYVYDVNQGIPILGKRLKASKRNIDTVGHKIAGHILKVLTGQDSFFEDTLVMVGGKTGNKEIYVVGLDGRSPTRVTKNGSINLSPAWSPKGNEVAWTSYKRQNPDLYIKNLQNGRVRALSTKRGINIGANYSPDGRWIALTRSQRGDSDIYIIDAATGNDVERVTVGGGIDVSPNFSPDGKKLAFASERSGGSQIFVYTLAENTTTRVSRQGSFNVDPVFSPDGTKLAFVGRDPKFDIFVLDLTTQQTTRITQNMGDNEDPSWSPDGKYLVFSSTRKGRSQIWLSTADGAHQVAVTEQSSGWSQPSWRPVQP